jgi:hypothetical protein
MLRNRVAHHEPLLNTDLAAPWSDILLLLGLIDRDLNRHVQHHSTWGDRPGQPAVTTPPASGICKSTRRQNRTEVDQASVLSYPYPQFNSCAPEEIRTPDRRILADALI